MNSAPSTSDVLHAAADAIAGADAVIVATGAGASVEAGLPTFWAPGGLYTTPAGPSVVDGLYDTPQRWAAALDELTHLDPGNTYDAIAAISATTPTFAHTSNVDGLIGTAVDGTYECHGSLHWAQCSDLCGAPVVAASDTDLTTCGCGARLRPNVCAFGDFAFNTARREAQWASLVAFCAQFDESNIVVLEIGAGPTVNTVRSFGETMSQASGSTLIRVNPDPGTGADIAIAAPAATALPALCDTLGLATP